jgi:hypothetical protein
MKHQRIFTTPPRRFTRADLTPHDGIPTTWTGDNPPSLPDGQAWAVVEDRPEPVDGKKLVRVLTAERDGWDLVDLTPEEIRAREVPATVTRRQLFLMVFREKGISRGQIKSLLAGNEEALIELEEAQQFERNHPLIESLATALGLSSAEVDELFKAAAAL